MATKRRSKEKESLKAVVKYLEEAGCIAWIPIRSGFNPNEIFGVGDGLAYDGSEFILFQVKTLSTRGMNWDLKQYAKKIKNTVSMVEGDTPLFWFFFVDKGKVIHFVLEENYKWEKITKSSV